MRNVPIGAMLAAALALWSVVAAGEEEARKRFQTELEKVYDYLPAEVAQSVRDRKVAEMDAFWKFVASDRDTYLPLLREALRDKDQNVYFCYDGAALLFTQSKTPEDLELVVAAFSRSRIEDVGENGYFYFLHQLCGHDVDVVPVVARVLEHPDFQVVVAKHSMQLGQADAMIFCLLRQDPGRWAPALAKRLENEKDRTARQTIVFLLGLAIDVDAQVALRKLAEAKVLDAETRTIVDLLLTPSQDKLPEHKTTSTRGKLEAFLASCAEKGRVPDDDETLMQDAPYLVQRKDVPRLRDARRKAAGRVSDEAMADIRYLTLLLQCATTSKG